MSQHHTESEDSTPPIPISRSTKIAAPLYIIIAFTSAIVATALAWSDLKATDDKHGTKITNLEERTIRLEQGQAAIAQNVEATKNNVQWMRDIMEGKYSAPPKQAPAKP